MGVNNLFDIVSASVLVTILVALTDRVIRGNWDIVWNLFSPTVIKLLKHKNTIWKFLIDYKWLIIASLSFIIALIIIYTNGIHFAFDKIEKIAAGSSQSIASDTTGVKQGFDVYARNGQKGDTFGGTLGPLVAVVAAGLTFLAFFVQFVANKQQRDDVRLERFENRFFKFIDYHRENVSQMKYADPKRRNEQQQSSRSNPSDYIEGNRAFTRIAYEFRELFRHYTNSYARGGIAKHFKLYPRNTETSHLNLLDAKRQNDNIIKVAKPIGFAMFHLRDIINLVYSAVFYGASKESLKILEQDFPNENFSFGKFATKPTKYNRTVRYYGGHARRLGHYFRNIYQAVKYVDEQNFLSEKQKYEYVTILRAQMSVYEQEVFFYNSLSDLGGVWEWEHLSKNDYPNSFKAKRKNFQKLWITKYDFVRNILNKKGVLTTGINIKDYYPLLHLEREKEFHQCGVLPFKKGRKSICRFCFNKNYINYYSNRKELHEAVEQLKEDFPNGLASDFNCSESSCETEKIIRRRS